MLNKWPKVPFRYRKRGRKLLILSLLFLLLKRNWVRNLLRVMFKHYVICHGILSCASTLHLFRGRKNVLCLRLASFEEDRGNVYPQQCVFENMSVCVCVCVQRQTERERSCVLFQFYLLYYQSMNSSTEKGEKRLRHFRGRCRQHQHIFLNILNKLKLNGKHCPCSYRATSSR